MFFTSESVTSGHPDKICDFVSDTLLDACLAQDNKARVALDVWVKDNKIGVIGELNTTASIDFENIIRNSILEIGYNRDELGFNGQNCGILLNVGKQSTEIHNAVDKGLETGAGDQGLMFGYACNQTTELMPLPIILAHKLAEKIQFFRQSLEKNRSFVLRPDGKTQVTVEYTPEIQKNGRISWKINKIDTILISTQHSADIDQIELRKILIENVIQKVIIEMGLESFYQNPKILINPSGSFLVGGPVGDSGLTGRKIVVDGYGGWSRVGGGAFSGKDATKVDRSGAYMARFVAKNLVAKGFASECELQVSYAIGKSEPVSFSIFGDLNKSESEILRYIQDNFDFRPQAIIQTLSLDKPIFAKTASYGHFGRPNEGNLFSWEKIL